MNWLFTIDLLILFGGLWAIAAIVFIVALFDSEEVPEDREI